MMNLPWDERNSNSSSECFPSDRESSDDEYGFPGYSSSSHLSKTWKPVFTQQDCHPFRTYFSQRRMRKEVSGTHSNDLMELQDFRNSREEFGKVTPSRKHSGYGIKRSTMKKTNEKPSGCSVIYIVLEVLRDSAILIPHNRELVANDAPDLYMIHLNSQSVDLLNDGPIYAQNYYPGDAVWVRTLEKLSDPDVSSNGDHVHYWAVGEFYLMKRHFIERTLITQIDHDYQDRKKNTKAQFVAMNMNLVVQIKDKLFSEAAVKMEYNKIFYAKIFTPRLQPEQFTSSVKENSINHLISMTSAFNPGHHVWPMVTEVSKLPDNLQEDFQTSDIFSRFSIQDSKPFELIGRMTKFGASGEVAMENRNRDTYVYPTKIDEVIKSPKGAIVKFDVKKNCGPPQIMQWTKKVAFFMRIEDGDAFEMAVISATPCKEALTIKASLISRKKQEQKTISQLEGEMVVVYQEMQDNMHHLKCFPPLNILEEVSPDAPIKKCLVALKGGPSIRKETATSDEWMLGSLIFTGGQKGFLNTIVHSNTPACIVNSCFRSGKSLLIAVAVNLRSHHQPGFHLATANTNFAVASLVKRHLSIDSEHRQPAVRLISQNFFESAEKEVLTEIDFPKLWPEVFAKKILEIDGKIVNGEETTDEEMRIVECALYHISKLPIQWEVEQNLQSYKLLGMMEKVEERSYRSPKYDVFETFLKIFQPKIIFATNSTITESLYDGGLKERRDKIMTVLFDEASQLSFRTFYSLGAYCPKARFAFLGDSRQLSPFADAHLPSILKNFAIGNFFHNALEKLPSFEFNDVYDSQSDIVKVCSSLFYDDEVRLVRRRAKIPETSISKEFFEVLKTDFPIQILDLTSLRSLPENRQKAKQTGSSLKNFWEAEVTSKLVKGLRTLLPNASIGILSYYKGQASHVSKIAETEDIFVGTVDSSQGKLFDVTIILTTKMGKFQPSFFLSVEKRLNVALSRSNHFCFLITDKKAAEEEGRGYQNWRKLFNRIPESSFHDTVDFLKKFPETENRV